MMYMQKKKSPAGKVFLLSGILTVAIIICGITLFTIGAGTRVNVESKPPANGSIVESGYKNEESNVAQAPSVKADPNGPQISAAETSETDSIETTTASKVYEKAYRSIVCITSYDRKKDYITSASGEGSGIVLTEDGYIATNSHVVNDSTKTGVLVKMFDDTQYLGTIIGIDKKTDLAVIKIDAKDLNAAEFADSDNLKIGELSFALGNPGGAEFSNSLTKVTGGVWTISLFKVPSIFILNLNSLAVIFLTLLSILKTIIFNNSSEQCTAGYACYENREERTGGIH